MIKNNELRLGNLVNYNVAKSTFQGEITAITKNRLVVDKVTSKFMNVEGVLLNEEWLKKLGFSLMTDTSPYNYRIHKNKSFCYIRYGTFGTFENGIEK
jgi:hypothetical protein